jgi:hypothetical protein
MPRLRNVPESQSHYSPNRDEWRFAASITSVHPRIKSMVSNGYYCCLVVADGALNLSIFAPGEMTLAGVQSLVVVFSTLQTGGSPRVQHDLEQVVLEQLLTTPLMVLVVLVGLPHVSAPHCFCSALAATGIARKIARRIKVM